MILIADSGSTKCDWMLLSGNQTIAEFSTMGFNPYFHDRETIVQKLSAQSIVQEYADQVSYLFFYGAGCSSTELKNIVIEALQTVFPKASVNVGHDLDGAALATFQGQPHIACILGTGSNSCFFDGLEIHEEIPALAYILGDEGSGSYIGKRLLADFFYKKMPENLRSSFERDYNINMDTMVEKVYVQPHANVYLASLAKFCSDHRDSQYVTDLVKEGIQKFLSIHVSCYPNYQNTPVSFVGSISHYFEPQLREAAAEMGIHIQSIVKKPIQGLVNYHLRYTFAYSAN